MQEEGAAAGRREAAGEGLSSPLLAVRQEEEGATSQGVWEASGSWKRQEEAGKGVLQRGPRQRLQKRKRPSPGFEPGEAHGRLPAHSTRGQDIGVV